MTGDANLQETVVKEFLKRIELMLSVAPSPKNMRVFVERPAMWYVCHRELFDSLFDQIQLYCTLGGLYYYVTVLYYIIYYRMTACMISFLISCFTFY